MGSKKICLLRFDFVLAARAVVRHTPRFLCAWPPTEAWVTPTFYENIFFNFP